MSFKTAAPQNVTDTTHLICLSGPFGILCFTSSYNLVILTISYLRVRTIETSPFPTDSSRPLLKQIDWQNRLYISIVSTLLHIRASYQSASSGLRFLGEIPAGAMVLSMYQFQPQTSIRSDWGSRPPGPSPWIRH